MNQSEKENYLDTSLKASDQVQDEDTMVCELVQRGLQSDGYDVGRYAPKIEVADFEFHKLLARQYRQVALA